MVSLASLSSWIAQEQTWFKNPDIASIAFALRLCRDSVSASTQLWVVATVCGPSFASHLSSCCVCNSLSPCVCLSLCVSSLSVQGEKSYWIRSYLSRLILSRLFLQISHILNMISFTGVMGSDFCFLFKVHSSIPYTSSFSTDHSTSNSCFQS